MSVLRRLTATLGATAAIGLFCAPATAAPPPALTAAAPTSAQAGQAAAGWLARQLVDGERFEARFGEDVFPDQGLTVDALLAFAAAGVARDNTAKALTWLAKPEILSGYVGTAADGSSAGSLAKVALIAQVNGRSTSDFGGVDLTSRLRALLTDSGRFSDTFPFGDFSNAFSQSFAILALDRTPDGAPAKAVQFLVGTQCPDGGFPLTFGQAPCASDEDSTAMVVQALLAAGGAAEAAGKGLDWLVSQQDSGGGFGGSGPTAGLNANSTGLAAQALRVAGRDAAADTAVRFLLGLQIGCTGPAANRGAIAYDGSGFAAGNAPRATAQAVLGVSGVGMATLDGRNATAALPVLGCDASPSPSASASAAPPAGGGGSLPVTGAPLVTLIVGGVLLVAAGVTVRTLTRGPRRDSTAGTPGN